MYGRRMGLGYIDDLLGYGQHRGRRRGLVALRSFDSPPAHHHHINATITTAIAATATTSVTATAIHHRRHDPQSYTASTRTPQYSAETSLETDAKGVLLGARAHAGGRYDRRWIGGTFFTVSALRRSGLRCSRSPCGFSSRKRSPLFSIRLSASFLDCPAACSCQRVTCHCAPSALCLAARHKLLHVAPVAPLHKLLSLPGAPVCPLPLPLRRPLFYNRPAPAVAMEVA